jgi:predicted transcriptional regulator
MMKYRSRSEIIGLVLQCANKGATKTRIMYGAYLSYAQVKEYLAFLQSKELLMYEEGTGIYRLTAKGLQFMGSLEEINDVISVGDNNSVEEAAVADNAVSEKAVAPRQW